MSLPLRPIAHVDGDRIAVYLGAAWNRVPIETAIDMRDRLDEAITLLRAQTERELAASSIPTSTSRRTER